MFHRPESKNVIRTIAGKVGKATLVLLLVILSFGAAGTAGMAGTTRPAQAQGKPSISVVIPTDGATITSTDIPVTMQVSNFTLSAADVGRPDKAGEGHIHVMLDGMNMGVLFNFYATPSFTVPGDSIKPGQHKLIFDLASNTHMDMADTVKEVSINYQPTTPRAAPPPADFSGNPAVQIISPSDGVTTGPKFNIVVKPTNFTPSLGLEGKQNIKGYGHYHVYIDSMMGNTSTEMAGNSGSGGMTSEATPSAMPESSMSGGTMTPEATPSAMSGEMSGGVMMSMAGLVGMPGSNDISLDLSAWPSGKHTIVVELVQNDHTPIQGGAHALLNINLTGTSAPPNTSATGSMGSTGNMAGETSGAMASGGASLPTTGAGPGSLPLVAAILGLLAVAGGLLARRLLSKGR